MRALSRWWRDLRASLARWIRPAPRRLPAPRAPEPAPARPSEGVQIHAHVHPRGVEWQHADGRRGSSRWDRQWLELRDVPSWVDGEIVEQLERDFVEATGGRPDA